MNIDESTAIHEKMCQGEDDISKLTATQNVIRNKFEKAYVNRLEHEHDVNQAMKPLTSPTTSLLSLVTPQNSSFKTSSLEINNINDLCKRLQKLINSPINTNDNRNQEITCIIGKLRELEIIV